MTLLRRSVAALLLGLLLFPWYRLVAVRGSGPPVEQTLQLGALYWSNLWVGVVLTVGAALMLGRLLPAGSLDGVRRRSERTLLAPSTAVYGAVLAGVGFFLSLWVSAGVLGRKPALLDGVAQLVHARYVAGGALSGPALPAPEFWQFQFMVPTGSGWVSQYPPGFAVALALGERLGVAWLVGPLLLAVALFLVTHVAERLFADDRIVARIGVALAALSPLLAFHAAAYMSHVLALALGAAAVLAALRSTEGSWPWSLVTGVAVGALFATRPYTAIVFGCLVLVAWLVPREPTGGGSPRRPLQLLGLAAGAAPFAAGVLLYNRRFFGSPLLFGYEAAEGPGHRLGFHLDPWGNPYGPAEAIGYSSADLQGLAVELLQTPLPALLLVALYLLLARRIGYGVALAGAWALLPVAAHALYWHHDLFMGPRLLYESVPAWCLLLAAAAVATVRAVPPEGRRPLRFGLVTREGVAGTFVLALLVGALYAAPRKLASYAAEGARSGMTLDAPPVTRPALVFVHGSWEDRLAARLDAAGMRVDSIRAALANNPTCNVELYLHLLDGSGATTELDSALAADAPTATPPQDPTASDLPELVYDRGSARPLRELRMPSGSLIRAYEGEALHPTCQREAASDFGGVVGLPPLLSQGDLPGLAEAGAMFVRDLGPERNRQLIDRYPEREPLVLVRRGETLRVLPYDEGIAALWSGPGPAAAAP